MFRKFEKTVGNEKEKLSIQRMLHDSRMAANAAMKDVVVRWDGLTLKFTYNDENQKTENWLRYNGFVPTEGS